MNYLSLQDYRNAILLALAMEQPGRLHSLFKSLPASAPPSSPASLTGHPAVDLVIRTLSGADLARLLRYVRDWNASAKTSTVAQRVLHAVVKLRRAEEIAAAFEPALGGAAADDEGSPAAKGPRGASALRELVEALVPYTERHLARMERLVQESYVVDYLLEEMDGGLLGDGDGDGDDGGFGPGVEWEGMEVDVGAGVVAAA